MAEPANAPKWKRWSSHNLAVSVCAAFLVGTMLGYFLGARGYDLAATGWTRLGGSVGPRKSDLLCEMLFDRYLSRESKVGGLGTVRAARHLVAAHCRTNGYWRQVLETLKSTRDHAGERNCVRILGDMLAADAMAREVLEHGEHLGREEITIVALGDEVVSDLLVLAKRTDRGLFDYYVIALDAARDPRTRDLFRGVLDGASACPDLPSARFHAAVGLANLGDPTGVDWLIQNCEVEERSVEHAWPWGIPDEQVGTCCKHALLVLSGQNDLRSRSEWERWWEDAGRTIVEGRMVWLTDDRGTGLDD